MTPEPMPVATFTNMRWSTSGQASSRSPSAMMLTSLSTSTGTSKLCVEPAGHVEAIPAGHDRRVDRSAGAVLDGPGSPMPIASRSLELAAELREQLVRGGR